jgi:hypothetical protein
VATSAHVVDKDDQYVLNHCTKYLARDTLDPRHDFGHLEPGDARAAICEAWRFPVVDAHWDGEDPVASYAYNDVTFVYDARRTPVGSVGLLGTFAPLYSIVPLRELTFLGEPTGFLSVTVRVPKGQVHAYQFLVDGRWELDPINPQQAVMDNGKAWSRFFTDACFISLSFTRFERALLDRLVAHLLPFRLKENRTFVRTVYDTLDRTTQVQQFPLAYLLDEEVGVVNYIDKLIARQERHAADDYHTCLGIIGRLLRDRIAGLDPLVAPPELYEDLYEQMQKDFVPGWDTSRYQSPRHFLLLLRRHAMTGAFVHPRHGGNSGAAGWKYLEDRFKDAQGGTLFDWRQAIETPLGHNPDYRG